MFDSIKFGKKIQDYRKSRGLTQEVMASQVGVTAQAVSKWENGDSVPDISTLPLISKVLGVSLDLLLEVGYIEDITRFGTLVKSTYRFLREEEDEEQESELAWQMFRQVFEGCIHSLYGVKRLDTGKPYCVNDHFGVNYTTRWDDDGVFFLLRNNVYQEFSEIDEEEAVELLSRLTNRNLKVLKYMSLRPKSLQTLHEDTGLEEAELKNSVLELVEEGLIDACDGGYCLGTEHMHTVLLLASFMCLQKKSNRKSSAWEVL